MWFKRTTLAVVLALASMAPAMARNSYYFVDKFSNKSALYAGSQECTSHVSTKPCLPLGVQCEGHALYCLDNVCRMFREAYNGGYQVDVRRSGTGQLVCKFKK